MDTQRTILWIIFSLSLIFLWDAWQKHQGHPSMFGSGSSTSSPISAAPGESASGQPLAVNAPGGPPAAAQAPSQGVPAATAPGATAPAGPAQANDAPIVRVETDVLRLDVSLQGGEVVRAELLKHQDAIDPKQNVVVFDRSAQRLYTAQSGLFGAAAGAPAYPNHKTRFEVVGGQTDAIKLADGQKELKLQLVAESGGLKLTKTYTLTEGSYAIDVAFDVENTGTVAVTPAVYMQLVRDGNKPPGESQFYSTFTGPAVYSSEQHFQKVHFEDIEKKKATHATTSNSGWVALIQHYFVSAWIPPGEQPRNFFTDKVSTNLYSVGTTLSFGSVEPGAKRKQSALLFVGPQDQRTLSALAPGLELVVDYSWLTIICKPIWWLLEKLHGLVGNWGWAIVLLTVIVKLIFFPLSAASYRSMARMKKVAPRIQSLRDKFGDDKAKMQQAMMEIYRTEKINPLGGCLPILVQMPVFIALYWVLLAAVEIRNAPWIGWIQDLASPDPFYILPLIMAGTMVLQTWLNPPAPDPVQQRIMWIMPIVFSVFFFFFPAGLVLYWLVNNVLSIAQQWQITRMIESGEKAA